MTWDFKLDDKWLRNLTAVNKAHLRSLKLFSSLIQQMLSTLIQLMYLVLREFDLGPSIKGYFKPDDKWLRNLTAVNKAHLKSSKCLTKGQSISKRLFAILEFFQTTNERIRHGTVRQKNRIRSFVFWKNRSLKEPLRLCLTFTYKVWLDLASFFQVWFS